MQNRNPGGFTLIESLVVVVIVSMLAAIAFSQIRQRQAAAAADTFVTLQAREMQAFAAAVEVHADETKAGWPVGARQEISAQQLIAAGKLSATFAQRSGTSGATPIGELYRAVAIKDAAGIVRIVIADFGRPAIDALVRRAGYQPTGTSLQGYKLRVADAIATKYNGFGGTVAAGGQTARGLLGGFTENLAAYFPAPPTMPLSIQLVGWPEHQLPSQPGTPNGNSPGFCNVLEGVGGTCFRTHFGSTVPAPCWAQTSFDAATLYREPPLPVGARNIVRIPICAAGMNIVATGVNGVALTAQTGVRQYTATVPECVDYANVRHLPQQVQITENVQTINLNNGPVFETLCGTSFADRNPATCEVIVRSGMSDANRVVLTTPVSYNTINGTQTFNALSAHTGNTRSTGGPNTRGHWFYCTDTAP